MTISSFAARKAKIQREMEKLQKQIEQLELKSRQPALDSIVRTMREYEITPEEVAQALSKSKAPRSALKGRKTAAKRAPVAPKYRNPETGSTWTGRGRAPLWVVDAEKKGHSRDEFLIEKPAAPASAPEPAAPAAAPEDNIPAILTPDRP